MDDGRTILICVWPLERERKKGIDYCPLNITEIRSYNTYAMIGFVQKRWGYFRVDFLHYCRTYKFFCTFSKWNFDVCTSFGDLFLCFLYSSCRWMLPSSERSSDPEPYGVLSHEKFGNVFEHPVLEGKSASGKFYRFLDVGEILRMRRKFCGWLISMQEISHFVE